MNIEINGPAVGREGACVSQYLGLTGQSNRISMIKKKSVSENTSHYSTSEMGSLEEYCCTVWSLR